MTSKPLAEVRKSMRVKWYRSPMEHAKLKQLSQRSDLQGWFQAGGHVALYVLTGIVSYVLWSHQNWFGFILALFLHGTVTSFFAGIAPHELGHGTVFRTKQLNKIFLYLTSLLSWFDTFDYNTSHTYHHRYTLHPDGDREVLLPIHPNVGKTFLLQMFTINLATRRGRTLGNGFFQKIVQTFNAARGQDHPNEWIHTLHVDQPDQQLNSVWWARTLIVFHGSVLLISIATGLWVLPILISLAPFIANWAAYFVSMPQHCGLMDKVPDFRKSVRSMYLNPILEFLYWRMNWHTEHHMYAGIPCYNLKKLYEEIRHDMPEPRTLTGAWQEMLATWERQKIDPGYQFDTPLPASATHISTVAPDALESSIGDLAPPGLR